MRFKVGEVQPLTGNITTLIWIAARAPKEVEKSLGYGPGRLSAGYQVALLTEPLAQSDFEFDGTTLRSGGKLGLPLADQVAEDNRARVHDQVVKDRGEAGYRRLQDWALGNIALSGPDRIAKVLPATRHDAGLTADVQYPMGGGGLQWKLVRPKNFLVALEVDADGTARGPGFALSLLPGAPYENRARVMRYLESAA